MSGSRNFGPTLGGTDTSTGDGDFPEAPVDGSNYVRRNGAWAPIGFASNEEVMEGTDTNKIVQPSNVGNLLDSMGIVYDESLELWVNDQGTIT